jgi:hypothetical protein
LSVVWSESPITAFGNALPSSTIAPSRTSCGGVGYRLVVCISAYGTRADSKMSTALRTLSMVFMPVLRTIGLPNDAMCFSSG